MTPEQRKAHLAKTAERIKKAREAELIKEKEFYTKITSGTSWLWFKIGTAFCILMVILTTYDTFFDGETKPISQNEYNFNRELYAIGYQSVWVDENLFIVPIESMIGMDMNSFQVTYSPIFGDPKFLSFASYYEDTKTPLEKRIQVAQKRISIYEWFPLAQIMLLLPLLVIIFKRQKAWFNFARVGCFILLFPGSILLLFTLIL